MADKYSTITVELLNELFEYSFGNLYWKIKKGSRGLIGSQAGTKNANGYLVVTINNKKYLVHRLIYFIHNKSMPKIIDHIDNNKTNNFIENLREATESQNRYNSLVGKRNVSGVKGVSWHNTHKKWRANICVNRKQIQLGSFEKKEDAISAIKDARKIYHKEFANNG